MAEIILVSVPAFGHVKPMLSIARALVERGHRVRWLTGSAFRERVEDTGAIFISLKEGFDYSQPEKIPQELIDQRNSLKGLSQLRFDLETFFVLASEGFCRDLLLMHEEREADLVVCDSFLMAGSWWSELTGRPWAQLCCSVLTLPSRALAPFGLAMQPNDSLLGRYRNKFLNFLSRNILFRSLRNIASQSRARLGLPSQRPWLFDVVSPYLVISGTVEGFEYPRPDLPQQVKFVGPLLEETAESFNPPPWWPELEGKTVVHVSQGTVNTDPVQLLIPTLQSLSDEPVLVVATTGRREDDIENLGPIPANARVTNYIPHGFLMPKVDLFITNGGFQGVQAALRYGVPMVTAGSSEDKPEVCARLKRCGAAFDLGTANPKPDAIRKAVRAVLSNSDYKLSAENLARQVGRSGGAREAAILIEKILK